MRANHRHCYGKKSNISASFDLEKIACNTCTFGGAHQVLHREVESTEALDASPVCFILSDQCFPPIIPVEGDGECFKILQIEDASIFELIVAFLDITKGFSVPAGSMVVLASASYLARAGTATYAAEYVRARGHLLDAMGGGIELLHGFPIFLSGTEDSVLLRCLVDFEHWLGQVNTGRDISRACSAFFQHTVDTHFRNMSSSHICRLYTYVIIVLHVCRLHSYVINVISMYISLCVCGIKSVSTQISLC
jgi:hypothetical protein